MYRCSDKIVKHTATSRPPQYLECKWKRYYVMCICCRSKLLACVVSLMLHYPSHLMKAT